MCSMLLDLNLTKESTPKACKVIYLEKEIFFLLHFFAFHD